MSASRITYPVESTLLTDVDWLSVFATWLATIAWVITRKCAIWRSVRPPGEAPFAMDVRATPFTIWGTNDLEGDVNGPTFLSTEIQRGRYRLTPSKQLFASREPVRQPMSERHHATDPERAINIAHNRLPGICGNIGRRRLKVSNAYRLC